MDIIHSSVGHNGSTTKTAVVTGTKDHQEAAIFALNHFNETPERVMDWDTDQYNEGEIVVRIYTR